MITAAVREKIKSHLGSQYAERVIEMLGERGVVNRNGKPYDIITISHIMNQRRENAPIEAVLMEIYNEAMEQEEEQTTQKSMAS